MHRDIGSSPNPPAHRGRRRVSRLRALLLALAALPGLVSAGHAPPPRLPCDVAPSPAWPAAPGQLRLVVWEDGDLPDGWLPPACSGWQPLDYSVLMAAVGRMRLPGGSQALLQRLGGISVLAGLRYWSVSRDRWTTLISDAHALTTPDPDARRADFRVDELRSGAPRFYWQHEPTTSGSGIYTLQVVTYSDDRLLVAVHNTTPSKVLGITMLAAGGAQTLYLFQHLDGDDWGYYQLTRLAHGRHDWLPVTPASYANRASALFRWFAQLPEDALPVWRD